MGEQELFSIIIISIVVMVSLAIGVLILYNTSQKRILSEVEASHAKELEYKNNLLSNSIEVQERERARIAKDLHDDIGSKLSIVNLNLNLLKTVVGDSDDTAIIIDQIESSLTDSITRARDISHDLYPPILEKFGIQSALESLAGQVTRTGVLKVNLDIGHDWREFDKAGELHIYRIFQELIHNTIKHAEAKNVWISSENMGDKMKMLYKDDGKGIEITSKESLGLGMSSIQTRIGLLEAEMKIDNDIKKGYKIEFLI